MKKSKLKVIKSPSDSYSFSFASGYAAVIGSYLIGIIIAILVFLLFISHPPEEGITAELIKEALWYAFASSIVLFLMGIWQTFKLKRIEKIMTLGEKVDGEIISYYRIYISSGARTLYRKPNHTVLHIKFNYNGEYYCSVNVGHKYPNKAIASHSCKLYIYGDYIFPTDFKLRTKGMPEIEFKEVDQFFEYH